LGLLFSFFTLAQKQYTILTIACLNSTQNASKLVSHEAYLLNRGGSNKLNLGAKHNGINLQAGKISAIFGHFLLI